MAGPRRAFRTVPARRKRVWARTSFVMGTVVDGAPIQIDLLVALGVRPLGVTVGPIIVHVASTTVATGAAVFYEMGVRVGSSTIEAVDQDPSVDRHLDWMLYSPVLATGVVADRYFYTGADAIRSNSMRKIEEFNETLWLVIGQTSVSSTTATFDLRISTMVMLP